MTPEERIEELEQRVEAAEAALTAVCDMCKQYRWRMPAALAAWAGRQRRETGMPLP